MNEATKKVRIDKWLWAARFFKTRSIAKQAIEGGKVHYNGARVKVSKDVEVGAEIRLRQGWDEKTIVIKALSDQRRGAPEAALLYEETKESLQKREDNAVQRKLIKQSQISPHRKPDKKARREIERLKHEQSDY